MTLKTSEPMGSTLRIKFVACSALFLLSGCSFFDSSVQTCEEPQEYQESVSILPLIVPDSLRNIQKKSAFNIPNTQGSNVFSQETFTMPRAPGKSVGTANQSRQMVNIDGDELSELLSLIDQTISNRQLEEQYKPIYENVTSNYESNPTVKPCLDGPPKYFTEEISPRSMPSQTYTQPSGVSEVGEEEKSRRQKRREKRQQRTGKPPQEEAEVDASSKDSEEPEKPEEDKLEPIFKVISSIVTGLYTGGVSVSSSMAGGKPIVGPKPTRPGDSKIIDAVGEIGVEEAAAEAEKIRNLAVLNPALNDEQRVVIQNMSDEQILEIVAVTMGQAQDQDKGDEGADFDGEAIEEAEATIDDEKDWSERVKDQWTEGKAQREARREARQQRRAERQGQDD